MKNLTNILPIRKVDEQEFVDVQNIYLDYLADRDNYKLSTTDNTAIYNAGLRKHPLAGFARSVYHTITGQKIPVTLTHLNGNTQTRSKNNIEPNVTTKIYPNPTDQQRFTIEMSDFDPNTQYQCTILDIFGQVVGQSNLSQSTQDIRLQNAVAGIYIVKISNFDKIVHVEKLIVK